MEGIQFEEEFSPNIMNTAISQSQRESTMIRAVLALGIVHTKKSAERFLIVVIVVCLLAIAIIIWYQLQTNSSNTIQYHLSPDVVRQLPPDIQQKIQQNAK